MFIRNFFSVQTAGAQLGVAGALPCRRAEFFLIVSRDRTHVSVRSRIK